MVKCGKKIRKTAAILAAAVLLLAAAGFWQNRKVMLELIRQENGVREEALPQYHLVCAKTQEDGSVEAVTAGENLLRSQKVKLSADSTEKKELGVENLTDGVTKEPENRWSSVNDWETAQHWLQMEFSEPVTVCALKLFWERTNAQTYEVQYSEDGSSWKTAASFTASPEEAVQGIVLEEAVSAPFFRIYVTGVRKEEADLSLYYQNISLYEVELYGGSAEQIRVPVPEIKENEAGERQLVLPKSGEGRAYQLTFLGADLEQVVNAEGMVADTIEDKTVMLGYRLQKGEESWDLPGVRMEIAAGEERRNEVQPEQARSGRQTEQEQIGAQVQTENKTQEGRPQTENETQEGQAKTENETQEGRPQTETAAVSSGENRPAIVPALAEWRSADDREGAAFFTLTDSSRIITEEAYREAAEILSLALEESLGQKPQVVIGTEKDSSPGDIVFLTGTDEMLGDEGYRMEIGERILVSAQACAGIRYGVSTLKQMAAEGAFPRGEIRDYPRYAVRGFGIDVGRRPVSLAFLEAVTETMADYKMNDLLIHLNDNEIITASGYDGTREGALELYAGFRLESSLTNQEGKRLTSEDLFYTKEDFGRLMEQAKTQGVQVVPEIDTPAHSLAITKIFPELGLKRDPEAADQLDLSQTEAKELVQRIWEEYLGEGKLFGTDVPVHIGMDEYFGDVDAYLSYLNEMTAYVRTFGTDREVRVWGSLTKMKGSRQQAEAFPLTLYLWDTSWANPQEMYEDGYDIINIQNRYLYVIPDGGYDYLDLELLEKEWEPNRYWCETGMEELPVYSSQLKGAAYMIWNDSYQQNPDAVDEDGLWERFSQPLPVISQKLWG